MFKEVFCSEGFNVSFEYGLISCKSDWFKWYIDLSLEDNIMDGYIVCLGGCGKLNFLFIGEYLYFYFILLWKFFFIFKELGLVIGSFIFFILMFIGVFIYIFVII